MEEMNLDLTNAGQKSMTPILVQEYIGGGCLFDYIELKPFTESVCRFLFS